MNHSEMLKNMLTVCKDFFQQMKLNIFEHTKNFGLLKLDNFR